MRVRLARRTVTAAASRYYTMVVVDGSPISDVAETLQAAGGAYVHVERQEKPGMGASRRQCFRSALEKGAKAVVWIEPEKHTLVPYLAQCIAPVLSGECDIVMPRRESLESYPDYQHWSELRAIWEIAGITGRADIDWMFGPRVWSARAMEFFLKYDGSQGSDNWEVIIVPFIWAIKEEMKIVSITVPYRHPEEQTKAESGPEWNAKRDKQRIDLAAAMRQEAARVGLQGLRTR
ncbi:MAG: hypothetical protein Q8Q36_00810 [bacterium]|nr:hypothetical protein [bacterium]